jgi:rRNA maturation endonuclease Nob1
LEETKNLFEQENKQMVEKRYLCKNCRHVFTLNSSVNQLTGLKSQCPACGGKTIEEAPCWAPLGSGSNIFEENTWLYECQECQKSFKMPIPVSPAEEKARVCPTCQSKHIRCLTTSGGAPLYCG